MNEITNIAAIGCGISTPVPNYISERVVPKRAYDTVKKIRSFATLPAGWHYGEGGPISGGVIDAALMWNGFLSGYNAGDTEAFASERGAITLVSTVGGAYTEVVVEPDNTLTIVRDEKGRPPLYRRRLSLSEAQDMIRQMAGEPWSTSAGFTQANTLPPTEDLSAMHFVISGTLNAGGSLLLNVTASATPAPPYVNMRSTTTPRPSMKTQSTGDSIPPHYQRQRA